MIETKKKVLAIDVGGVLASKQHDGMPVDGSIEAVTQLAPLYDLWIVSQCGKSRALQTKQWLKEWGFDGLIPPEKQIYIGFDQPNKNQVLQTIKADFFVDDRTKHINPAQKLATSRSITCFLFNPWTWPQISAYLVNATSAL